MHNRLFIIRGLIIQQQKYNNFCAHVVVRARVCVLNNLTYKKYAIRGNYYLVGHVRYNVASSSTDRSKAYIHVRCALMHRYQIIICGVCVRFFSVDLSNKQTTSWRTNART